MVARYTYTTGMGSECILIPGRDTLIRKDVGTRHTHEGLEISHHVGG